METWLLTWNPKYYNWNNPEDEDEAVAILKDRIARGEPACMAWSCGPNKRIQEGNKLYVMRLGIEPKGIVASGHAASNVFPLPHWDPIKAASGGWKQYINVKFDKICDSETERILPLTALKLVLPAMHWTPISSGIRIPPDIADQLGRMWDQLQQIMAGVSLQSEK